METRENPNAPESGLSVVGVTDTPLAPAAALDSNTFAGLNPNEAIPATWEERARKAWEYYPCLRRFTHCTSSETDDGAAGRLKSHW